MGKSKTIGIAILAIIWIWLVWMLLAATGVNLKNLLIVVMTGIIPSFTVQKRANPFVHWREAMCKRVYICSTGMGLSIFNLF